MALGTLLILPAVCFFMGILLFVELFRYRNPCGGYRTKRAMKSDESWQYANKMAGIYLLVTSPLSLAAALAIVFWLLPADRQEDVVGLQVLFIVSMIPFIEYKLKRYFDEEGKCRDGRGLLQLHKPAKKLLAWELVCMGLFLFSFIFIIVNWRGIPAQVPFHSNPFSEARYFIDKTILLLVQCIAFSIYLAATFFVYLPCNGNHERKPVRGIIIVEKSLLCLIAVFLSLGFVLPIPLSLAMIAAWLLCVPILAFSFLKWKLSF